MTNLSEKIYVAYIVILYGGFYEIGGKKLQFILTFVQLYRSHAKKGFAKKSLQNWHCKLAIGFDHFHKKD